MPRKHPPVGHEKLTARQAENLLALRQRAGWTHREVVGRLGVATPTYSRLENGHRLATLETALRLARVFGVTVEDLYR